jgi:uncharacterized protein
VVVTLTCFPSLLKRSEATMATCWDVTNNPTVDAKLAVGAAIFGVGWGLSGLCPGPAVVYLTSGTPYAGVFGISLFTTFLAFDLIVGTVVPRLRNKQPVLSYLLGPREAKPDDGLGDC